MHGPDVQKSSGRLGQAGLLIAAKVKLTNLVIAALERHMQGDAKDTWVSESPGSLGGFRVGV